MADTKLGSVPIVTSVASTDYDYVKASGQDAQITEANKATAMASLMFPAFGDYAASSTIIGWSAFTDKIIRYNKLGKMLWVWFVLRGTSNNINSSFTIPYNAVSATASGGSGTPYALDAVASLTYDNGVQFGDSTRVFIDPNVAANKVTLLLNGGTSDWTNHGTKDVRGEFFVELA